jgi:hypothetical protein
MATPLSLDKLERELSFLIRQVFHFSEVRRRIGILYACLGIDGPIRDANETAIFWLRFRKTTYRIFPEQESTVQTFSEFAKANQSYWRYENPQTKTELMANRLRDVIHAVEISDFDPIYTLPYQTIVEFFYRISHKAYNLGGLQNQIDNTYAILDALKNPRVQAVFTDPKFDVVISGFEKFVPIYPKSL